MWIFLWIKHPWHSCSIWENLNGLVNSGNISVSSYLPLIQEDSVTHVHGLSVYVKKGLPFAWDLPLENFANSLCTFIEAILSNVDEVLSITQSANMFLFGGFNVQLMHWLTFLVELIDLVNSVKFQMTLLRWLIFLLGSLTTTLTVLLFWIYLFFIFSNLSNCSTMTFFLLGNSYHVVVLASINFPSNLN